MMRFESLTRLVESADFTSFREMSIHVLNARGFRTPAIRDGWSDGGSDVAVYSSPLQALPFAIQVSVEGDWRSKIRQDARKAKRELNTNTFLYISSRRIAESEFRDVADELLRDEIHATRMDAQGIASLAIEKGFVPEILKCLGLPVAPEERTTPDVREVAAYAYAFFGADSHDFRTRVIERTALTLLAKSDRPIQREELVNTLLAMLQLAEGQQALVTGSLDRLLQQQGVVTQGDGLVCGPAERAKYSAAFAVRAANLANLKRQLEGFAAVRGVRLLKDRTEFADAVVEHLGALMMAQGQMESGVLVGTTRSRSELQERVRDRLRSLHGVLDAFGLPVARRLDDIKAISEIAMKSAVGGELLAGEVFLSLTRLGTSRFIEAAASAREFNIALDASVAMPILCAQLHGTASQRFFLAAQHLLQQARLHRVPLVVPKPYLEECAAHLLAALRDYLAVIDQDEDLRGSQNAYVAHFKLINPKGGKREFRQYLGGFGLTAAMETDRRGRDRLMAEIAKILRRYDIRIVDSKPPLYRRKEAEEALAHAQNELSTGGEIIYRPTTLLKHDAFVIALLNEEAMEGEVSSVLCSWDRLHFHVHEKGGASFDVMDPAALGDMLSLALADEVEAELLGPTVLAMQMSEEEAERGAIVWDAIVGIESSKLTDAALLEKVKEFKSDFLARHAKRFDRKAIQEEWLKWKNEPGQDGPPPA